MHAVKCAICGRSLFKTAVMIGSEAIGPSCFKRVFGVIPKGQKSVKRVNLKQRKAETRDNTTLDLFEGE